MSLPEPRPSLVICYSYLWRSEHNAGETEGRKNRPCVIMSAEVEDGMKMVVVIPVTHAEPADKRSAVEIPRAVKKNLGMDSARSWIVCSDANKFAWPGMDLCTISRDEPGRFDFGFLPPRLFNTVREKTLTFMAESRLRPVPRTLDWAP